MYRIAPLVVLVVVLGTASCGGSSPTAPGAGSATVYFVSPSGSDDNAGTIAAPWRTIRHAVEKLTPGNTLYLMGGEYSSPEDTIDSQNGVVPSGTSWSAPITIAGYSGEPVTLRPPDGYSAIRLTVGAPHHLIFQDFAIDMSRQSDPGSTISAVRPEAIYVADGAHHIRFQRLDVGYTMNDAIALSYNNVALPAATFVEVLSSRIHHAGLAAGDSGHGGAGVDNGYGIYMKTTDNVIDGNDFYDNSAYAIVAYSDRNIFRNNTIHDNGTRGGTNYGIGIGSSAYPLNSTGNIIQNNTIYNNRGGIQVYTNSVDTKVQNNSVYNNRPLQGIFIQDATGTVVSNNNVYGNGTDIVDLGSATVTASRRR